MTTTPANPLSRLPIPSHGLNVNGGNGSFAASEPASTVALPIPNVALGQIAPWLQRVFLDTFHIPSDDPIHATVEMIRACEQNGLLLIAAMLSRTTKEEEFYRALAAAQEDLGKLGERERENLRPELKALLETLTKVTAGVANFTKVEQTIALLPEFMAAVQADVTARARERWGQSVALIITALIFLTVGFAAAAFFFMHFFKVQ